MNHIAWIAVGFLLIGLGAVAFALINTYARKEG